MSVIHVGEDNGPHPGSSPERTSPEMRRTMLKSKIHRATVTQADLNHVSSLILDRDLMDAADLLAGGQPHVVLADGDDRIVHRGSAPAS